MKRCYWQICYTDSTYCDTVDRIKYTKHGVWYRISEEKKYTQFVPWERVKSIMKWRE